MSIEVAIASISGAAEKYALPLEEEMIKAGIVLPLEKAHFIAQIAFESLNFTHMEENLNYSAKRLIKVFPKYFPTMELAQAYEHKPQRIGNRVYANRMGNGTEASGDGYAYRGRSPVHLTGRDNYWAASHAIFKDHRLIYNPNDVLTPEVGAKVATWYWVSHNCKEPAMRDDLEAVTRRINGGLNGLEGRRIMLARTKEMFWV